MPDIQGAGLITKACDILDLVGSDPGALSIQDISEHTGIAKSTVYRIVSALGSRGFLRSDQRGQNLSLGFHFLDLAQNVWAVPDLITSAVGELRRLRDMTGETAYLAALSGSAVVSLAKYVGAHENSSAAALGVTKPLHCTSQGKAILAHLPSAQAERIIASIRLDGLTPHTITSRNALRHRLDIVRQRGFAVDDQEIVMGTRCVGAPVIDRDGACVGAISIAGPSYRMTLDRIEQLGPDLIDAAQRIGSMLAPRASDLTQAGSAMLAVGDVAFHGCLPLWSDMDGQLYWADRLAPAVHVLDANGAPRMLAKLDRPIEAMVLAPEGGVWVVCEGGWFHVSPDGEVPRPLIRSSPRMSVLRRGRDGVLWGAIARSGGSDVGIVDDDGLFAPIWSLAGEIRDLAPDDDGRLIHAVGGGGVIYELKRDRAAAHILTRIPRGSGEPRGIGRDGQGRLWLALWDGWSIARLDEHGEIERIHALPVPRPTGIAFGGPGRDVPHVTTARLGLQRDILENAPLSGRLLIVDVSEQGKGIRPGGF